MPEKICPGGYCPGDARGCGGWGRWGKSRAPQATKVILGCILRGQLLILSLPCTLYCGDSRESLFLKNKWQTYINHPDLLDCLIFIKVTAQFQIKINYAIVVKTWSGQINLKCRTTFTMLLIPWGFQPVYTIGMDGLRSTHGHCLLPIQHLTGLNY